LKKKYGATLTATNLPFESILMNRPTPIELISESKSLNALGGEKDYFMLEMQRKINRKKFRRERANGVLGRARTIPAHLGGWGNERTRVG